MGSRNDNIGKHANKDLYIFSLKIVDQNPQKYAEKTSILI